MDFSDSDDDLLPSFDKFNAMFTQVQKQARQASPPIIERSTGNTKSKSSKKTASAKKNGTEDKPKSSSSKETTIDSKIKAEDEMTEDTKRLLDEIDKLTNPIICCTTVKSEKAHSSKSIQSSKPPPQEKVKPTRTRGRGRGRKKIVVQEVVQISDDECTEVFDASFGTLNSLNDNDVMEIEPEEFCSLRIRWKHELLRFRVPKSTKMSQIRMEIAEQKSTRADNLVILEETNSEEISDNILVDSIPFGQTLEAFERSTVDSNSNMTVKNLEPGFVLIKLQGCGGYRERCAIAMKKTTHVKQLIEDYKEKFGYHGKAFKLVFDGEDLDLTETPESLDLENNDMIDIVEI